MMTAVTERKLDLSLLILLPIICVILFIMAVSGFASNRDTGYAAAVQLACIVAVIILPLLRVKKIFMAPNWFIFVMTSNIYMFSITVMTGIYDNFWWWSPFSHWYSGVLVTLIVFMALLVIKNYTTMINIPSGVLLFIAFMMGLGFGCLWEMWETSIDVLYGRPTMLYSAIGTIRDLYMDALGSLTMLAIGAVLLHFRTPADIIGGIGLDHKMKRIGEKWDRRCGKIPEKKDEN
jgi:hypothetical protein